MPRTRGTFSTSTGNVLVTCESCGKLTHSINDGYSGTDLCKACLEQGLYENECSSQEMPGCTGTRDASCPHHGERFARLDAVIARQRVENAAKAERQAEAQVGRNARGLALWEAKLAAWDAKPRCAVCYGYRASNKNDLCSACNESVKYYSTPRAKLWAQNDSDRHYNMWQRVEIEDKIVAYGGTRPAWPFEAPRPGAGRRGMGY